MYPHPFSFDLKKKVEIPKDSTVENRKINGISIKNSESSMPNSLIPKNQNKMNENDFVNISFINKKKII